MPVTAAAREIAITYNGHNVGGSSTTEFVHGFIAQTAGRDRASVSFDVVLVATTPAAFATACAAIEAAYSTPFANLTVAYNGSNIIAVTQSGNTGLDAMATIEKPGGPPDSALSRRYRVRVEYGVPATWATVPGLRDSHVILSKSPSGRALVTLRGTFTALPPSSDAKAVHDAAIDAWADAQRTWLGITTWELVEERALDVSVNRKTADFERVYQELVAEQAAVAVVRQTLTVTRARRGSEHSPQTSSGSGIPAGGTGVPTSGGTADVVPLTDIVATYEAWVDKAVTTDLRALWETIEPFVIDRIAAELGTSSFGMMTSAPTYNADDNRISATITGVAADVDATSIVQNVFEQSVRTQPGYDFVPVWNGNPEAAIVYQGQQVRTRTTSRRWRVLGGGAGGGAAVGGGGSNGGMAQGWGAAGSIPYVGYGLGPFDTGGSGGFGGIDIGGLLASDFGDALSGEFQFPGGDGSSGDGSGSSGSGGVAGGGGGSSGWFVLDRDSRTRPIAIGRKPFLVYLTEYATTLVERAANAVA